MIDKQPEKSDQTDGQLNDQQIASFAAFFKVSSLLQQHSLHLYDWDVNHRENRQFYIDKSHQTSPPKSGKQILQVVEHSQLSIKSSKKSVKPKVQGSKKIDNQLLHVTHSQLTSKIVPSNHSEQLIKTENQTNILGLKPLLPPSSIKISQKSEQKKPQITNAPSRQIDEESISEIPVQRSQQQSKITILPMMSKQSRKKHFSGLVQPEINTLNEFMVKPLVFQSEPNLIRSNLQKSNNYSHTISKKPKKQQSLTPPPAIQPQKINSPSVLEVFTKKQPQPPPVPNFQPSSIVKKSNLQQKPITNYQQSELQYNRSKSKSATKIKKVKDSTIFAKTYKIYQPHSCFHTGDTFFQQSERKQSSSPEVDHSPITHLRQVQLPQSNQSSNRKLSPKALTRKSSTPIPVQDYDNVFDRGSRQRQNCQYNTSEMDENISPIAPNSRQLQTPKKKSSKEINSNQRQIREGGDDLAPLPYFSIPMGSIKKPKHSPLDLQNSNELQPQKPSDSIQLESQSNQQGAKLLQKSTRKKIFSHQAQEQKSEKQSSSTDLSEYTEEEMRMILAARGNKYKQTIVKQYIRLQRETHNSKANQ